MNTRTIKSKIERLSKGQQPRVLDLFAGCGGLSTGFQAAGYEISAAIEFDSDAAKSHGINFHSGDPRFCKARDITETKPDDLIKELELGKTEEAFDIIIGGPPCQAFARVGRSKLREVSAHPEAFRHDPRSRLYIDYLQYVTACAPLAVVLENVPDMLNFGGRNIAHEISEVLTEMGYVCGYTLLNAAYYGVPQMRERAFLMAIRKELTTDIRFPEPSHWIKLPPGYEGSRAVAQKLLNKSETGSTDDFWKPAPEANENLPPAVTARQALADLPKIYALKELEKGTLRRATRRLDKPIAYPNIKNLSDYAHKMRNWPGFEQPEAIVDHVIRYLPRDYKIFARLNPGDQYPAAYQLANKMFEETLEAKRIEGIPILKNSAAWRELKNSFVPPYDHTKFPNKWRKMEENKPARTLMAHLGKDSYSHIHYDSKQARTISVREAARLQSFPDGFVFYGTMNPAFKQIGNAVPPLLALAIGECLLEQITEVTSSLFKKKIAV